MLHKSIKTRHQINAPIESIWSRIKSGEGWESWFTILKGSKVVGNTRFCELENGDVLEELFLAQDAEKTFVYNVHDQHSFPAENIVGLIRLEAGQEDSTIIHWSVDLDVEDESTYQELNTQISAMYSASVSQLEALELVH